MAARTTVALAGIASALLLCSGALAAGTHTAADTAVRQFDWHHLTLAQRAHAQRQLVIDDWRIITTYRGGHPLPYRVWWHTRHMRWTKRELATTLHAVRLAQRRVVAAPVGYPPHHRLWLCIASYEGAWGDTSPPYTGGLQMHLDWYGVANAGYLTQAQQEWAAERAWAANGGTWSFLYQQWYEWDAADGCGTTG